MATLERIRSKGVFLLIIIGLALLAFIIGDFLNNSSSIIHSDRDEVGEIDGDGIKYQNFQSLIDQFTSVYKIEVNPDVDDRTTEQIRETVWQNLLRSKLIEAETEKIGIAVNENEIKDATIGNNPDPIISQRRVFADPQTGRFDHNRLVAILNQLNTKPASAEEIENYNVLKNYWDYFEKEVRTSRLERKYLTILSKGVNANKLEAKMDFESSKNTNNALYTYLPYSSISDQQVSASDKEIKDRYEQLKAAFKLNEENRNIEFVVIANEPSAEDNKKAADFINKLYPEFSTTSDIASFVNMNSGKYIDIALNRNQIDPDFREFAFSGANGQVSAPKQYGDVYKMARIVNNNIMQPDSVRIRHIFVAEKDSATTKKLADSLTNLINNGADFAQLAAKYSKVQQTAQNGGDTGWMLTSQIENKNLLNAILVHPVNVTFQYKEETDAIQIMQVTAKTNDVRKAKIAIITSEIQPSKSTTSKNYNIAKNFAGSSTSTKSFEDNAKKNNFNVYPYTTLTANTPRLQNLDNSREIVRWAFNDKTEVDAVSDVFDCGNYFVVATLKDIEPKGYRSIDNENVKEQIKYTVLRDKKAELISNKMNGASNINALAAKLNTKVDTASQVNFTSASIAKLGNEPSVIAAIALSPKGALSKPIKGNQGVYFINVTETVPNISKYDEKNTILQLTTRELYSVYRSLDALMDKYEVKDNRKNFY